MIDIIINTIGVIGCLVFVSVFFLTACALDGSFDTKLGECNKCGKTFKAKKLDYITIQGNCVYCGSEDITWKGNCSIFYKIDRKVKDKDCWPFYNKAGK